MNTQHTPETTFGSFLKNYMYEKSLGVRDLAHLANVSTATISDVLNHSIEDMLTDSSVSDRRKRGLTKSIYKILKHTADIDTEYWVQRLSLDIPEDKFRVTEKSYVLDVQVTKSSLEQIAMVCEALGGELTFELLVKLLKGKPKYLARKFDLAEDMPISSSDIELIAKVQKLLGKAFTLHLFIVILKNRYQNELTPNA